MQLIVGLKHNKIVDILHVGFIYIFLPQFLTYGLVRVTLFEVVHLQVSFVTLEGCIWDYCSYLRVRECCRCLGNYGFLASISVSRDKVLLQLLRHPVKIVQVSQSKIKDVAL